MEHYDWRVLFYMILPFSIIATLIGVFFLKNVTEVSRPKLDMIAIILSTLGFGGLLYGFSDAGNDGWSSTPVVTTLAVGAIALIPVCMAEMKTDNPMLEFRIFKYNMFTLTTLINVIVTMAMYA